MLGRQIAENVSFADGGMTSFDMLRVIARLESAVGHLPKALLFDQPTCRDLALWLEIRFGAGVFGELHGNASPTTEATGADRPTEILPDGAVVVAKHRLSEHPDVAAALVQIEAKWAKEGGLPGRDIAPLVFLDSRRAGYLNFSERDGIVLAWSCAVAEEDFHALVGEWVKWAAARNLRPNFLSMLPVEEVAGVPFCSTPFGTVQRLHGIGSFSLEGGQMQRLRQKVQKFERSGTVRVDEYPMGSDSAIDARIVSLIDQWAARKDMVNPYVETVRSEVAQGIMADRHRVYLTVVDDEIVAAVVITKIPSENGYLLDLEFFGDKMTDGGLDYTIVQILKRLAAEGCDTFSFGATLGVVVGASKNPHPAVAKILQELRDAGLFRGDGNFQFKNKYRPKNLLVYLCQPATASPADVSSVILLIANPTIVKKPKALSATPAPERLAVAPVVVEPAQPPVRFIERVLSESPRQGDLRQVGWNPLALPRMAGASEMVTDSWAERDEPAIADRARELAEMGTAICGELIDQTTLPFTYVQATPSGRAAEATLLRALGPKRTIIQTNLFPSWMYNALDLGYRPVVVRTRTGTGDVDLDHLKEVIAANAGTVGLCCVELASNASGGRPLSLQNAIGISEATRAAGIPLVFDAARGIDNACAIADAEGRDLWSVVRELFSLATAITLSMPKNFGVTSGGLVATSDPAITRALRQRVADRGQEVSSAERRLLAAALGDRPWVEAQSRKRIRHTEMLAARLRASGAPVRASGGHAVLLDAAQMCGKRFAHPMASALAWLYETAGVRAAPHLAAGMPQTESCIRLAVPVGLADSELERVADELSRAFGGAARPADLLRLPDGGEGPAFYQPREQVPDDVAEDIERGKPIARTNENWAVVSDWQPSAVRRIVPHEGGEIEVFEAGHGPPVVFLHPFNIGLGFFAPQMRDLASTHRVIGIHAPGVGATVNIADLSFAGLARAVVAGVRGIGVTGRFFVAGASFGGLTALSVAHRHPDDVAGLILLGSSYRVGNRKGDVNRLAVVAREDFDALSAAGVQPTSPPREELEGLLLRCESIDPKIGLRYLDQFAERPDLLSDAATLAVPTLIMHGVHDTVIKLEVAQLLHRTIPGANFVEIADAGHFPSLTSADQVNALIAGFTKGIQSK
jgi:pimeloyl-ACP methyl ester carboxylesterase